MKKPIAYAILLASYTAACAPSADGAETGDDAITGGTVDEEGPEGIVSYFFGDPQYPYISTTCTVTVVAPDVVLTSRGCHSMNIDSFEEGHESVFSRGKTKVKALVEAEEVIAAAPSKGAPEVRLLYLASKLPFTPVRLKTDPPQRLDKVKVFGFGFDSARNDASQNYGALQSVTFTWGLGTSAVDWREDGAPVFLDDELVGITDANKNKGVGAIVFGDDVVIPLAPGLIDAIEQKLSERAK